MSVYQAVLNEDNICVGLKKTKKKIEDGYHVEIENMDSDYIWRKYEDGEWTEEKYKPEQEDNDGITLDDLQKQAESSDLDQVEMLAEVYEKVEEDNLDQLEAITGLFEALSESEDN